MKSLFLHLDNRESITIQGYTYYEGDIAEVVGVEGVTLTFEAITKDSVTWKRSDIVEVCTDRNEEDNWISLRPLRTCNLFLHL